MGETPGVARDCLQGGAVHLEEGLAVRLRHDEQVTVADGSDVHEGDGELVFMDEEGGRAARDDLAEDALDGRALRPP